jgi:Fe-S cluster assembly iron-binding protein IscA
MLTITADAEQAVRVALEAAEAPESAGIRLSTSTHTSNGTGPEIKLELVEAPDSDDAVIGADGARIFLAPDVAPSLDDKLLDAEIEPDGEIHFALFEQI